MERLILLRHGKAESDAMSGQDFDRALTPRGRRDTLVTCQALVDAGLYPNLVLVSPAARAVQTWEAASSVFSRTLFKPIPSLYEISPAQILALAKDEGRVARTLMIIGHNPGLGVLSAQLAHQYHAEPEVMTAVGMSFPTAAASVTQFEPKRFTLYTPRALGGGV
jgi:phosphohistidine phosphatase